MIKKALRYSIPFSVRHNIWSIIPKIFRINTLVKKNLCYQDRRSELPARYSMREILYSDAPALKAFYQEVSPTAYNRKIPKRLISKNCKGFAIFETDSGFIVYNNWLIHNYGKYLREFGIDTPDAIVFWDSAYCLPQHRHQGFHEIMEQELINYCINKEYGNFYMQIHTSNHKGNNYARSKGYELLQTNYAIYWPVFDVFRSLNAFIKAPFRKVKI